MLVRISALLVIGGFVDQNEPLEKAAARELEEETGLTGKWNFPLLVGYNI